jgi:hypothetical protein
MTKKDYILIAAALHRGKPATQEGVPCNTYTSIACNTYTNIATHIATALATDNPRFNRSRFLEACGLQSTTL